MDALPYKEIWLVDFEFTAPDGERPVPLCMVAREHRTGRLLRLWRDELMALTASPFSTGEDVLFVAYYASAEMGCFLALKWPLPARVLDLCAEFKLHTSGLAVPCGRGLLGALTYYGLDALTAIEKDSMRALAMRGGDYISDERQALLDYCQTDVDALDRLLPKMLQAIDLPRALVRGRYMTAAARIEWNGVPIDTHTLSQLRARWTEIQDRLIKEVDKDFGVYDGRTFKQNRWADFLRRHNIPWPILPSGTFDLKDDCFREMARSYPQLAPLRELRHALSELRLNDLAVGGDGRNRCLLSAFQSRTGRNQPSNSKFIFGPAVWLRSLIQPAPGWAIAYVDWEQQEFGIGGALSGDRAMMDAYSSGDPYLEFAKQAGAVPRDGTKAKYKVQRDRFKVCALAVQYGMGADALAAKLGESPARGRELLSLHRKTYPDYWAWSDGIEAKAMLHGSLQATFGWTVHVDVDANPRSLRNFPLQANGAEMLRIACCAGTERGLRICAPVHDALLIEAPISGIEGEVAECQAVMQQASEIVLDGFPLRTDAKIFRYPDRYLDERGSRMWETVQKLLVDVDRS